MTPDLYSLGTFLIISLSTKSQSSFQVLPNLNYKVDNVDL